MEEHPLIEGPVDLTHANLPILRGHLPESGVGQVGHTLTKAEVAFTVAFPPQSHHSVGAGFHVALDVAGEVNAKEWKLGVGHRIDQPGHQMMALRAQCVVLAPERDDLDAQFLAGHSGHLVGIQPGAVDQMFGLKRPFGCLQCHGTGHVGDLLHRGTGKDVTAGLLEFIGEGDGYFCKVDYPRVGRPQCAHSNGVRLDLFQSFWADDLQVRHSVGRSPLKEVLEAAKFRLVQGDYDLSALLIFDLILIAELDHVVQAGDAELGLVGAGPVVDPRVHHATIMAGLVRGKLRLFLDHSDPPVGGAFHQLHGRGQPQDAASDDRYIVLVRFHLSPRKLCSDRCRFPYCRDVG